MQGGLFSPAAIEASAAWSAHGEINGINTPNDYQRSDSTTGLEWWPKTWPQLTTCCGVG